MAPSQLQAVPTPRMMRWQQGQKKTKQTSVLDFATWDDMAIIFSVRKAARRSAKKKAQNSKSNSIFLRSHNSVGCKVRSSRPSAGRFLASPHRDHLGELHRVIVWAKKAPRTVTQTIFEKNTKAKRVMTTVYLTIFQNFSRQYSNSIQTILKTVLKTVMKKDIFRTVMQKQTVFEQYSNSSFTVQILFLLLLVKVRFFKILFALLFRILFYYCSESLKLLFYYCWDRVGNYIFLPA